MDLTALHKIGYGMYIIGSHKDGKLNGQVANTVFQITSEPPTIAVSINKKNITHEYIKASRVFSASVLCQETPLNFIGRFGFKSGRDLNKLEGVEYKIGTTGAPVVLQNATSYIEARVTHEIDVGTHTIFVGDVVNAEVLNDKVCMSYDYYRQIKRGTTPVTAPTYTPKQEALPKYKCMVCDYVYEPSKGDPDAGIPAGTKFEDLPANWRCPICGVGKDQFEKA